MSQLDPELALLILEGLDGVAITDAEGRYLWVNRSWSRLTGLSLEDVAGKLVRDIIPESRIHETLATGERIIGHGVSVRRDGVGDAFSSYYPIMKNGKLIGGFIHVIITGMRSALEFSTRVNMAFSQMEYYKNELRRIHGAKYSIDNIIGESPAIRALKESIRMAASTLSTVLIEGETGCGKELVAHAIHDLSPRKEAPLIKVNCAAIPSELLESEFFGYREGAFTGASRKGRIGKFELADGGSLFLDEINQMPMSLQPKILRVLQEKEIEPLASKASIQVNVRMIAASNVDLARLVSTGRFRNDLFYRLNVVNVKIPPLRERKEDIALLCDDILHKLNFQLGMRVEGIEPEVVRRLASYRWPGNVRELQNVIERAMNMSRGRLLRWKHFEAYFKGAMTRERGVPVGAETKPIREAKAEVEREVILQTLERTNGNKTRAAESLGLSRTMLYKKMHRYGLFEQQD
ncbi:MAG: sigma 54-interacting transcriptional regulator [Bacillota bacterium]|nr:sigma 54-interacting transcriptional regulator [Bacillota bacterium]